MNRPALAGPNNHQLVAMVVHFVAGASEWTPTPCFPSDYGDGGCMINIHTTGIHMTFPGLSAPMSPCHNIPLISSCHLRESDMSDMRLYLSRDHTHLRQLELVNYLGRDGRLMPLKTIWCNSDPSPAHSHVKSAKMLITDWLKGMDIRRSAFKYF